MNAKEERKLRSKMINNDELIYKLGAVIKYLKNNGGYVIINYIIDYT